MNREELWDRLFEEKMLRFCNVFGEEGWNDCTAIFFENGEWIVCYISKGIRKEIEVFDTEEKACKEMYQRLFHKRDIEYRILAEQVINPYHLW